MTFIFSDSLRFIVYTYLAPVRLLPVLTVTRHFITTSFLLFSACL
jgi:hypothetical protein